MKQIEKDVLVIGIIDDFLKETNKNIHDFIPNYDRYKLGELAWKLPFMKNEQTAEHALRHLAADAYKRIEKKMSKVAP